MRSMSFIIAGTHAPAALEWNDLKIWLDQNFNVVVIISGISLWISLVLILRLWRQSPYLNLGRRITWSLVLCVPLLGWLIYGGCFRVPPVTDAPLPDKTPGYLD